MEKFESDPEKYVPAWGGFCAYGVAEETWWTAETMSAGVVPDAWRIIDGRLFFFHDIGVAAWFAALLPDAIREGDATWHGWGLEGYNTNCFNTAGKTGGQLIQPDLAVRPERHAPAVAAVGAAEAAAGAVGAEGSG
uniref:Uncharacterized protein n=2 Tax=Heterosigma akashiwo TaxID=2829 RepID=A0A7S3XL42_HETAK